MKNMRLNLTLLPLLSGLLSCTTIHETKPVEFAAPQAFDQPLTTSVAQLDQAWWHYFNSAELERFIALALQNNQDLKIATERILQAEYALRSVGASRYPNLNLSGKSGATTSFPNTGSSTTSESSSLNLNATYELDLWNRNRALIQSSAANLSATEFDFEAARLSLTASVAQTYFEVLTLQESLELAKKNLIIVEQQFEIVETKYKNGVVTLLDVSRQRTAVLNQKAAIIPIENKVRQSKTALAILIGLVPQGFDVGLVPLNQLTLVNVTAGLPSELLKRRPDIAASEQRLIGADANIYAEKANLWPQISLTAGGGIVSDGLLFVSNPASSLALAASFSQSLFDAGRKENAVLTSESKYREALQGYYKNVLNALQEVEETLGNIQSYQAQEQAQAQTLIEAQRSLALAELRYKEGAEGLTTVLDSQRSLFQTQDQVVKIRQQRLSATVDLYKVMGGGWEPPAESQ